MKRRDFLKMAGGTALAAGACAFGGTLMTAYRERSLEEMNLPTDKKMGMVIDLDKCQDGCTACLDACRHENNVAFFGDKDWDVHWIRKVKVRSKHGPDEGERSVLLLCNHCDKPPCAQVCPVQATYKRHDGVVIVDHHRCIGCRYCMIACPYNARYFNFKAHHGTSDEEWPNKEHPRRSHGVAESCTLCVHRLDTGREPACVEACKGVGQAAICVGDMNDPDSGIAKILSHNAAKRLKEDLGTEPKVYYMGLKG